MKKEFTTVRQDFFSKKYYLSKRMGQHLIIGDREVAVHKDEFKKWLVFDLEVGYSFGGGNNTKKEALEDALKKTKRKEFKSLIQKTKIILIKNKIKLPVNPLQ